MVHGLKGKFGQFEGNINNQIFPIMVYLSLFFNVVVHQLYTDGQYSQCISEIHESKDCDSFTRDCQTLLLANCHAHNVS